MATFRTHSATALDCVTPPSSSTRRFNPETWATSKVYRYVMTGRSSSTQTYDYDSFLTQQEGLLDEIKSVMIVTRCHTQLWFYQHFQKMRSICSWRPCPHLYMADISAHQSTLRTLISGTGSTFNRYMCASPGLTFSRRVSLTRRSAGVCFIGHRLAGVCFTW